MKRNRKYRIVRTISHNGGFDYYRVYVYKWFWWFEASMHGYGNMFHKLEDAEYYIKLHSKQIPEYSNTVVKEYNSCQQSEQYIK